MYDVICNIFLCLRYGNQYMFEWHKVKGAYTNPLAELGNTKIHTKIIGKHDWLRHGRNKKNASCTSHEYAPNMWSHLPLAISMFWYIHIFPIAKGSEIRLDAHVKLSMFYVKNQPRFFIQSRPHPSLFTQSTPHKKQHLTQYKKFISPHNFGICNLNIMHGQTHL